MICSRSFTAEKMLVYIYFTIKKIKSCMCKITQTVLGFSGVLAQNTVQYKLLRTFCYSAFTSGH